MKHRESYQHTNKLSLLLLLCNTARNGESARNLLRKGTN